jgi:lysophospholipase L1-like esterase
VGVEDAESTLSAVWTGKTARTVAVMALVLAIPYASPKLTRFRVARAPWDHDVKSDSATLTDAPAPTIGDARVHATENQATVTNALPTAAGDEAPLDPELLAKTAGSLAVEDPTGHALDAFYTHLQATSDCLQKPADPACAEAQTRILHYGDSVITSDFVSGTMRRLMQKKFGDAGHGFILVTNPWEWYFHNDVRHSASDGWNMNRITGPLSGDGMYGLGGVSFHTDASATAWFATTEKGDYGRSASRFDIYYLEQPSGGGLYAIVPGKQPEIFSTAGPKKISRIYSVHVPDGAAEVTIKTTGSGEARVFGVAIERDVPGIVYDALGANGARARLWWAMSADHWKEQMDLRKPALIILQYGTNESEDGSVNETKFSQQFGDLIEKIKTAAPGASVLVASPLDRAEKADNGDLQTKELITKLVTLERKAALDHGVAFWNTYEAMGGKGTMARWVKADPQLASWDLTHPTPAGAEVVGNLFFKALTTGYDAYESRTKRGTR